MQEEERERRDRKVSQVCWISQPGRESSVTCCCLTESANDGLLRLCRICAKCLKTVGGLVEHAVNESDDVILQGCVEDRVTQMRIMSKPDCLLPTPPNPIAIPEHKKIVFTPLLELKQKPRESQKYISDHFQSRKSVNLARH